MMHDDDDDDDDDEDDDDDDDDDDHDLAWWCMIHMCLLSSCVPDFVKGSLGKNQAVHM